MHYSIHPGFQAQPAVDCVFCHATPQLNNSAIQSTQCARALQAQLPAILDSYRQYKAQIPVYGGILLDEAMERVLLVSEAIVAPRVLGLATRQPP